MNDVLVTAALLLTILTLVALLGGVIWLLEVRRRVEMQRRMKDIENMWKPVNEQLEAQRTLREKEGEK